MENSDNLAVIHVDDNEPQKAKKTSVEKLKKFVDAENICKELGEEKLQAIYQECMLEYDSSYSMMKDKVRDWKQAIELVCMQSTRDKPFDGASDVVFPLSANAVINLASKAFNAFFPDDDIYKGKIVGEDNGIPETKDGEPVVNPQTNQPIMIDVGEKSKAASRVALSMNYQVKNLIPNWKADTIQLLYGVIALGTMYRKEAFDELKQKNVSTLLFPDKIIVNKNISSLEDSVFTEIFELTKNDIQANINKGLFIDYEYIAAVPLNESTNLSLKLDTTNAVPQQNLEAKYQFGNQHTYLDLDEDGFKEPYCVTFDRGNQKIVRITADYTLAGVKEKDGYIYNIERIVDITPFRCMPSFDGSFWGTGLPFFLANINSSINTSINQLIDSMHLKIKGGGFVANDLNIRGGALTFKMGEFKKIISLGGGAIADKFYSPAIAEPSPVMLALLEMMINTGKDIGLLRDVLTGNITANMAPTTFLGLTENAVSIENSIFKLLNESFIKEIKVRRRLNSQYFDRELYNKINSITDADANPSDDFLSEDVEMVLLTDSSNITKSQKMAKAQLFESLKQDPFYNALELRKKFNEAIGMPELNTIIAPPPPAPQADIIIAQAEDKKAQAKLIETETSKIRVAGELQEKQDKAALIAADIELRRSEAIKNIADAAASQKKQSLEEIKTYVDSLYKEADLKIRQQQTENDRNQSQSASNS